MTVFLLEVHSGVSQQERIGPGGLGGGPGARRQHETVNSLLMRLEVIISGEELPTKVTLEALLLGVSLDMPLQMPTGGECLGTLRTVERELLPCHA